MKNILMKNILSATVLALILSSSVATGAWSSGKAPPTVQVEFNEFLPKFRAALKADDATAIARMATLPFQGDAAVSTAAQFQKAIYKKSFTKKNRACIQRGSAVYDRDQENNDNYLIFCGELIFVFTKTSAGFRLTDIAVND
jgi:hypothetical protein